MKKSIFTLFVALVAVTTITSCDDDDKSYLTLPVYEMSFSSSDIHVGDEVTVSLNVRNSPKGASISSYTWSCSPEVDGLTTNASTNNSFTALQSGTHEMTVAVSVKNYADGKSSDSGKTVTSGNTENLYTVSTLYSTVTVTCSFTVSK